MVNREWFFRPTMAGHIEVGIAENGHEIAGMDLWGASLNNFFAALCMAAIDAHAKSQATDPPAMLQETVHPIAPSTIALLSPQRNKLCLVIRLGRAEVAFDISDIDMKDLGEALIAASASTESHH